VSVAVFKEGQNKVARPLDLNLESIHCPFTKALKKNEILRNILSQGCERLAQ
jgi:hypothetical protein